ncbi:MAG: hypothetical protein V3R66_01880 [Rhodospirillales bacterium]
MLKLVSKALLSLVLEEDARDRLGRIGQAGKAAAPPPDEAKPAQAKPPKPKAPYVAPDNEISFNAKGPRKASTERRELIRQALDVRRSKEKILDNLSLEEKLRLHIMASEVFKVQSPPKKK